METTQDDMFSKQQRFKSNSSTMSINQIQ